MRNAVIVDAFRTARGKKKGGAFVDTHPQELLAFPLYATVAWLIWVKLLKPAFLMLAAAAQRAEADRKAAAEAFGSSAVKSQPRHAGSFDNKLKSARDTARQEPKLIAELIREWMGAGT